MSSLTYGDTVYSVLKHTTDRSDLPNEPTEKNRRTDINSDDDASREFGRIEFVNRHVSWHRSARARWLILL